MSSNSIEQKLQKYNSLERLGSDANFGPSSKNIQMLSENPRSQTPNFKSDTAHDDMVPAFKVTGDDVKISVPPLNTKRLLPKRHKTRDAIMSILETGEVVIEFIKYQSQLMEDRIVEVCKISNDGYRIVLFKPNPGRYVTFIFCTL